MSSVTRGNKINSTIGAVLGAAQDRDGQLPQTRKPSLLAGPVPVRPCRGAPFGQRKVSRRARLVPVLVLPSNQEGGVNTPNDKKNYTHFARGSDSVWQIGFKRVEQGLLCAPTMRNPPAQSIKPGQAGDRIPKSGKGPEADRRGQAGMVKALQQDFYRVSFYTFCVLQNRKHVCSL